MPKEMRLIDADAIADTLRKCRGTAERKADDRAVKMLDWVMNILNDAPTITVCAAPAEKKSAKKSKKKAEPKHKYGQYKNVLLSDTEMDKLREEFPHDWEARIEAVSTYVEKKGVVYKNFLAVIRDWEKRDEAQKAKESAGKPAGSFDTDEFVALAMARTYGGNKE